MKPDEQRPSEVEVDLCPDCDGFGELLRGPDRIDKCARCGGSGAVRVERPSPDEPQASPDRLEITREDAERLLVAIAWTEGEGQVALSAEEEAAFRRSGFAPGPALDAANDAHDALRDKLRAFVKQRSPDEPRSREAGGER